MQKPIETPVCIIGAGPSGASASIFLSKRKIPHIILEKAKFPRDKVCGDGLTIEALHQLRLMSPSYLEEIDRHPDFLRSLGAKFINEKGKEVHFDLSGYDLPYAPFYTCRRSNFDEFLLSKVPSEYADLYTEATVTAVSREHGKALIEVERGGERWQVMAPLVFGADGERSIVSRQLGLGNKKLPKHTYASIRTYYSGVTGMSEQNDLEFFFLNDLLPGYLWVFPMPEGKANVGVIMLSDQVSKGKVNLRKLMDRLIGEHPLLAERFAHALAEEKPKGWGLPLSSSKKPLAGENFFLLGDAGSLIEPFTGKGIGVGMISGNIAAEFASKALEQGRYDADFLMGYSKAVYRRYEQEWLWLYRFQRITQYPKLISGLASLYNLPLVKKASLDALSRVLRKWMG